MRLSTCLPITGFPVPNRILILGALILLLSNGPCATAGEVYHWKDDNGRRHYSDRPPPQGAQSLRIDTPTAAVSAGDVKVRKVYDGDTIQLENGEKVRLLGINTPERGRRGKDAEAGAEEAKAWLQDKLAGRTIRLETDAAQRDRYQRLLAHVFLADGTHVNLGLVREGLATTDIFPPNLKYVDTLLSAEREAQVAKRGLWALPDYQAKPLESLRERAPSGWQRLVGKVVATRTGKRYARLQFQQPLEVRIPNEDLHGFPPLQSYAGQTLEVRGWASRSGPGYAVTVHHPGSLVKPSP